MKSTITFILILFSLSCNAAQYKVLFTNSNKIKVGNSFVSKDFILDSNDSIRWNSQRDAIEVRDIRNGRVYTIAAKYFFNNRLLTVQQYIWGSQHLSTESVSTEFVNVVDTTEYSMLNTLYINAPLSINNDYSDIAVVWNYKGETIMYQSLIKYDKENHQFVIPREIFNTDKYATVLIRIIEILPTKETETIYSNIQVDLLPIK